VRRIVILLIAIFLLGGWENIHTQEKMNIEIIPIGQIDILVLDYLRENLTDVFEAKVSLGKSQPIPEYAFNKKRGQYYSSEILENLTKFKQGQITLAIIERDLYVPELNFVFGEADSVNQICIISLMRLNQSYYGLPEDKELFLRRSLKEAVHEIGHLLGLGHCPNPKCVMHFSNSLLDTDIKDYRFCDVCQRRLRF
jgi:archaemetzincin